MMYVKVGPLKLANLRESPCLTCRSLLTLSSVGRSRAHSRVFDVIVNQKQLLCDSNCYVSSKIIASILESIMLPKKFGSIILPFRQNYG